MSALEAAQQAYQASDWAAALRLLDEAGDEAQGVSALELRAMASYGNGDFEAAVSVWEGLHDRFVGEGDQLNAARAAVMVAMFLLIDTGLMATVRAWLRRAEQLLEDHDGTPVHALVAAVRTYERFMCGDLVESARQAKVAIGLGRRNDVDAATVIGRTAAARVKVIMGDIDEGMAELEELGALLTAGATDPLTTGMMYCELICAAQGLAMYDRAREWTEVMDRWRGAGAIGGIDGRCRVHRAELLRLSGPCEEAEAEALRACETLRPWMRREFGWPLAELGTIRLRKGDLAGAEEALLEADRHTWSPQPSLALLRLEQGNPAAALRLITDAVDHPLDIPSKEQPPYGELRLAPLLDAQAEIAQALGDGRTARAAAERLGRIAQRYSSRALAASADLARARAELIEGDHAAAIASARSAAAVWAEIGAPFETAVIRTVTAEAYERQGNLDAALLEWRAAEAGFAGFGARLRAERSGDRARSLLGEVPPDPPAGATPAAVRVGVFRADQGTRLVGLDGVTATMADLVGLRYVARLLAEPGREFHALDLTAVEQGTLPGARVAVAEGLPVLDDQARRAYRRRLADIEEDIEDATARNDLGRLALAERDREYLLAELRRAVGLDHRPRTTGGSAERARSSVTRSIRYGLGRLGDHQPDLASHLERRILTGMYCSYRPDPLFVVAWQV